MSSLIGLLNLGGNAILAQNAGVAVTGNNISNANTEGYSRQNVNLESELAAPLVGGVRADGTSRADDQLLASRERSSSGAMGKSSTQAAALGTLESDLTSGDVISAMGDLFAGLAKLAGAPADPELRASVIASGQAVATAFNSASSAISHARSDGDARIADDAKQATQLAAQIASANKAIAVSADPVLADKRDLAARKLAELVGGEGRIDPDGQMRFVAAGGAVIVDGARAATVSTTPDGTNDGHLKVQIVDGPHVQDVTTSLDGGKIGGELAARDGTAKTAASALDQLAYDLATQMNAVHRANAGTDGGTNRDFFTAPAVVSGAAASLSVSATLVADPRQLATAALGAGPGSSDGVLALSALKDQPLAGGGTRSFFDEGIRTLNAVGTDAKAASDTAALESTRSDVLAAARDSVSGVSTQEEMTRLSAFQHASEAATQFVSTVNQLLTDLIQKL